MRAHQRDGEAASPDRRPRPPQPASAGAAERILALQRTMGNSATAGMIEEERGGSVHDVLRSPGRPLAAPVRREMEARLGADFSTVRVHDDSTARRSATEIGARAYTSGEHVVLGNGGADMHTMAHELTHVVQQRSGPVSGTDNGTGLAISDPDDRFERAAEATAHRVMTGPVPGYSTVDRARPARVGDAVQRIREVEENGYTFKLTENDLYAIIPDYRAIWAQPGAPISAALAPRPGSIMTIDGRQYQEYQIRRWLLSDCLHTAEEIINNLPGELASARELPENAPEDAGLNSRIMTGDGYQPFGQDYNTIKLLASKFTGPKNYDAAPALNQAFVTIATRPKKVRGTVVAASPYHAGAVVAVDGADRITLEEWDARGFSSRGGAGIYRVGDRSESFHAKWGTVTNAYFRGTFPTTVVVEGSESPNDLTKRTEPFGLNEFEDAEKRSVALPPSPAGSDTEQQ